MDAKCDSAVALGPEYITPPVLDMTSTRSSNLNMSGRG